MLQDLSTNVKQKDTLNYDFNNTASKPLEKFNTEEIKREILSNLRSYLSYLYPNGTFHGNEFRVGDKYGSKGQSLKVTLTGERAGLWYDFNTEEKGDVITFWAIKLGKDTIRDFREIMSSLSEWLNYDRKCPEKQYINRKLDEIADYSWNYYDENGQVIVKVYRKDPATANEKKEYKPFDVKRSKFGAPEGLRPLYNIPGILKSDKVILVEGEKCAESLIEQGITATTTMFGAHSSPDKTDWSQLKGKHITIWPDNDESGKNYADNAARKLLEIGVASLAVLKIPQDKPEKWDAADCVLEGISIEEFLASTPLLTIDTLATEITIPSTRSSISFSGRHYLNDKSPMPEDIIAPRILTPSGLLVFAGAPKVGKSDFLISWLFHMAAGVQFLDMVPKRPLRVFYLQTEIGYHYMRERIQQLKLSKELIELAADNIMITPQIKLLLNDDGIEKVLNEIKDSFDSNTVDIIAIDPLRNIFDAGENGNENDNSDMLFFLQERVEKLRTLANRDAGVILVHHTKKIQKKALEEDPFQSFSGAGSLRSFYTTGMIMFRPDEQKSSRQLIFELRNGHAISSKYVDKTDNCWQILEYESQRLIHKNYGEKLDAERSRRYDTILQLIYNEARNKGKVYTTNTFCQVFENKAGLGSKNSIRDRIDVLAAKGYIKFNRKDRNAERSKYGILCVEGMERKVINQSSKDVTVYEKILPTDYRSSENGDIVPVEDPNTWIYSN